MKRTYWALLILGLCFGFSSCLKTQEPFDVYGQFVKDTTAISNYLKDHNITNAVKHSSGVFIVVKKLGKGVKALTSNIVDVVYKGMLLNGTVFEQGNANAQLQTFIVGWQIAFSLLPAGSEATIYIPSYFAYGQAGQGSIPPNTVLAFDVTFKQIVFTATEKTQFKNDTTAIHNFIYTADNGINPAELVRDSLGLYYTVDHSTDSANAADINIWTPVKMNLILKKLQKDQATIKILSVGPTANSDSRVANFIRAINIVAPKMKPGSVATVFVPSTYGYNVVGLADSDTNATTLISPNTNFILEIQMINVVK
jgi:FKBP-type peptidyl-prolyl cis-trans isomerase FkpA